MKNQRVNKKEIDKFLADLKKSMVAQIEYQITRQSEKDIPPYERVCKILIDAVTYVRADSKRSTKNISQEQTPITFAISEGSILACDAILNNILINCDRNKKIMEMCEEAQKRYEDVLV